MAAFSAVANNRAMLLLGRRELCLLISLYFKVLQQLGSFAIELRKAFFHLLPDHIKMKEAVLTGAKRKMEAIGVLKKKKKATKPDFTVVAHFLAGRRHTLEEALQVSSLEGHPNLLSAPFVLENFYEPFKKKKKVVRK